MEVVQRHATDPIRMQKLGCPCQALSGMDPEDPSACQPSLLLALISLELIQSRAQ